jgi:hypothetical protein
VCMVLRVVFFSSSYLRRILSHRTVSLVTLEPETDVMLAPSTRERRRDVRGSGRIPPDVEASHRYVTSTSSAHSLSKRHGITNSHASGNEQVMR